MLNKLINLVLLLILGMLILNSTACTLTASVIDIAPAQNSSSTANPGNGSQDSLGPVGNIDEATTSSTEVPIIFNITFNEPIESPSLSDFLVTNGYIVNIDGSGQLYTVAVYPNTYGNVTLTLKAASFFDLQMNTNTVIDSHSVNFQSASDPLTLLKKVNPSEKGSFPKHYLKSGGLVFFTAETSKFGRELWVTDGTENGTNLVKDINPGLGSSDPEGLFLYKGKVFFGAKANGVKIEIWVSDGTSFGTYRLKDFGMGGPYVNAYYPFYLANGILFFHLLDGTLGRTDGTESGTYQLRPDVSWVSISGAIGNRLLFRGQTSTEGAELYYSEGTEATTQIILDLYPGSSSGFYGGKASSNSMLFSGTNGILGWKIWKTDGTSAGTVLYENASYSPYLSDNLYFFNWSGNLYSSDGISPKQFLGNNPFYSYKFEKGAGRHFLIGAGGGGAHLFSTDGLSLIDHGDVDLVGNTSGSHKNFIATDSGVFFPYNTAGAGWELRFHDGTLSSQVSLGDQNSGTGSLITDLELKGIAFGNKIVFRGFTSGSGMEIWISDGTQAGTFMLKDIYPGVGSSFPDSFYSDGSAVYFSATDGVTGFELWRTDGTQAGTIRVANIERGPEGSSIGEITVIGSDAYFVAYTQEYGKEIWKTDGTTLGTVLVKDIVPNSESSYPHDLLSLGSELLFIASGSAYENLYKSDGTTLGTEEIKPGFLAGYDDYIAGLVQLGSNVYFQAGDTSTGAGRELFKSDGTSTGTGLAADLSVGSSFFNYGLNEPAIFVNKIMAKLIFVHEFSGDSEPWSSDGTSAGSQLLSSNAKYAYGFFNVDGKTYFMAYNDPTSEYELWVTDGTPGGTSVLDIESGIDNSGWIIGKMGSNLLFLGDSISEGKELWMTDGTMQNTQLIKDLTPGVGGSSINFFSTEAVAGKIYFSFDDGLNGTELWVTDGTSNGTMLLKDIYPGNGSSYPSDFMVMGSYVYFAAESPGYGRELWRTDGSVNGTIQLIDSVVGSGSLSPESLTRFGSSLLFIGQDINGDKELHRFIPPL